MSKKMPIRDSEIKEDHVGIGNDRAIESQQPKAQRLFLRRECFSEGYSGDGVTEYRSRSKFSVDVKKCLEALSIGAMEHTQDNSFR